MASIVCKNDACQAFCTELLLHLAWAHSAEHTHTYDSDSRRTITKCIFCHHSLQHNVTYPITYILKKQEEKKQCYFISWFFSCFLIVFSSFLHCSFPFFLLPSFRRSWPFISPSFSPFLFQVLDSHISLFLPANSISYMDCSVCCKFLMQFNPFVDQFFGRAFLLSLFCLSFLMEISPSEMHSLFSSFLLSIIHCFVLSCCR